MLGSVLSLFVLCLAFVLFKLLSSFLMSVFHNGLLRTMKANYYVKYVVILSCLYHVSAITLPKDHDHELS